MARLVPAQSWHRIRQPGDLVDGNIPEGAGVGMPRAPLLDTQSSDCLKQLRSVAELEQGHRKPDELIAHQISLLWWELP